MSAYPFLLLDENLSYRFKYLLSDVFDCIDHVAALGMSSIKDEAIYAYARQPGCVFATYDKDFLALSDIHGPPPSIIRIRNISGKQSRFLRDKTADGIRAFMREIGDEAFASVEITVF